VRYAAYGSNLHPHRLCGRVPSAKLVAATTIPGWGLQFNKRSNDGSAKCNIVSGSKYVLFALFDIDPGEKPALDKAEGLNDGYEEKSISVLDFGQCFTYVASQTHIQENLQPYSWYKELVIMGLEYHQAYPDYLERVRSVTHVLDENMDRHEQNMAIVSAARNST